MAEAIRPIEHYILSGLQRRIYEVMGVSADFKYSPDPFLQADGSRGGTYPLAFLRINNIEHRREEGNSRRGDEMRWHYGSSTSDGNAVNAYRLVAVRFDIGFTMLSNDIDPIRKLMNAWMFSYRFNSLNYRIVYDTLRVDIKVLLQEQIDVPWQDEGLDNQIEFEFQAPIEVWGYMSQTVERRRDAVRSLELSLGMPGVEPEYSTSIAWPDPSDDVSGLVTDLRPVVNDELPDLL